MTLLIAALSSLAKAKRLNAVFCLFVSANYCLGQIGEPPPGRRVVPIVVTVAPATAVIIAGQSIQIRSTVSNTGNQTITWSVNPALGSISQNGLYTAPATVSAASAVIVTATSVADGTKKGTSVVTVNPGVAVSVTPGTGSVTAGGTVQLTAAVTGTTNQGVTWTMSPTVGTLSTNGLYTAPSSVSSQTQVTVRATSVVDGTKMASAVITVNPPVSVSVTPATATVSAGGTVSLSATVAGAVNTGVTWSLSPAIGTISSSGNSSSYAAPATVSQSVTVEVTATSVADPTKSSKALFTLMPLVSMSLLPASATVKAGKSQQFSISMTGVTGLTPSVNWTIEPAGFGTVTSAGLYTAPAQVAFAQRIKVKASTTHNPVLLLSSDVNVMPEAELTFTLNNNGLETVVYRDVNYNYKYGEGLVQSIKYGEDSKFVYSPACAPTLSSGVIEHNCSAGPTRFRVTARHTVTAPSTLSVEITVTNQSATETLREVNFSTIGTQMAQLDYDTTMTLLVNSDNPVGVVNFVQGRYLYWLDTPGTYQSLSGLCGWSYICKHFAQTRELAPGETRTVRLSARYTTDMTSSPNEAAPEAYRAYANAFPMSVNWPDRRPIMAWWIAEGSKRSEMNPRGYFQDPLLNVSDVVVFRARAMEQATKIRDLMNARPVRPQGLIIWDLEGQEFIHPTTYIGDPRVFSYGYAAEMNGVADDIFKTFRDAGYRVGVTIRPQSMQWGTQLPPTCTYSADNALKSYYIKVDNPYRQRFHGCFDPAGITWSVVAEANGSQTEFQRTQVREVTELLKSKIRYASERWGATLFYIDSAVWPGGGPLNASILRELQQTFPNVLLIPEQEGMETMSTSIPYSDSRIPDAKFAPLTWRWAFPTGAFAVAIGDCQDACWQDNLWNFQVGQKIGDIAIYAQPQQMNPAHLPVIESMIQRAREESSKVTVTDSSTLNVFRFNGDVTSQRAYPVKLRVYFGGTEAEMVGSDLYCEAAQWLGENSCSLNLSGKSFAEVRYYDFTNKLVSRAPATRFR